MLLDVKIGEAIRLARGDRTQEELANAVGALDQSVISRWEGGQVAPSFDDVRNIEQATGRQRGFCWIAAGYVELPQNARGAIESDPGLTDVLRSVVLAAYDSAVSLSRATAPKASAKTATARRR